ncbi:MAG TPA: BlaI/MecI/CopY family transcriptional regulator [Gemmatimonadota bacterium]|nr:BlaI/MecI/CopY family transcriptional regulator [Gemmatimonadota bacterium]
MKAIELAEREMEVMRVLWDRGSATVSEARELLGDPLAYTTVLTVFRTLEEKGFVRHEEEGRAYRYYPLIERDQARSSAVRRLLERAFDGSAELLMTHLVAERDLSPAEIRRIKRLLDERLRDGRAT